MPSPAFTSLNELLRARAERQPERCAYTFLADGETETERLTYGELDRRARRIGAWLQTAQAQGERVLLLYPPGLELIAAFFGCMYAGAIAVPAYPPRLKASWPRLAAIVADAQAELALSTAEVMAQVQARRAQWPQLQALRWCATSELPLALAQDWCEVPGQSDTPAFLQYTSGSTSMPKGVLISQRNLLHNLEFIRQGFDCDLDGISSVFWLPPYHDMGLIGGVLGALYVNSPSVLMPPTAFVEQPGRWLAALSHYRGTISGAPNFAYDWCVERIPPAQRAAFDLSCWEIAFCGAEPVRLATLERFAEAFAPCGFRREAFYPCYGLAEATLMVAGSVKLRPLFTQTVSRTALRENRVAVADAGPTQTLVGCGHSAADQQILIVDPETLRVCPPDAVGEIWVAGPSVAQGYWNQPEETRVTFGARLAGSDAGPFLRTGDLGFMRDGQLFIAGRLKDLLVMHGRNHHPQDLEETAEASHPALQPGRSAAFSIDGDRGEKVVLVCELKRSARDADVSEVAHAVRVAVAEAHELEIEAVVLIRPGHLPRTTSGKAQRYLCREKFLDHTLPVIGVSERSASGTGGVESPALAFDPALAEAMEGVVRQQLAEFLHIAPEQIELQRSLPSLGLGSLQATALRFQVEESLRVTIPPELLFADLTVEQLIHRLAAQPAGSPRPIRLHRVSVPPGSEQEGPV